MKKIDIPILWTNLTEEELSRSVDFVFEDYDEDGLGRARGAFNKENFYLRKLLQHPMREFAESYEVGVLLPVTDAKEETVKQAIADNRAGIMALIDLLGIERENMIAVNPLMFALTELVEKMGPFEETGHMPPPSPPSAPSP